MHPLSHFPFLITSIIIRLHSQGEHVKPFTSKKYPRKKSGEVCLFL
jgi:hypothetical protein